VEYLGLIIREGEIAMDPVKIKAITDWPTPKTVKQVQSFLGFCNFYRRFITKYSEIARPLFDLTKKDTPFNWTEHQEEAFLQLKNIITSSPVLLLPDYDKPFRLTTDASDFAMGAVLEQEDSIGRTHPVAFWSKTMQPAERNYEIHDKELMAIVKSLEHFRHYLQGNKYTTQIFSDHANLKYFTTKQHLTRRQARWALFLSTFDFKIIPKPGNTNRADSLSRRPDYKEGIASENSERIMLTADKFLLTPEKFQIRALTNTPVPTGINEELQAAIIEALEKDRLHGKLLKEILTSGARDVVKGLQEWNHEKGLIYYRGLVYVPNNENLKRRITAMFHDGSMGHPGQYKTIELITREYYWPGVTEFVKKYIEGCATCQMNKIRPPVRVPTKPTEIPTGIWETITMDFITDLPKSHGYDSILTVVDRHSKGVVLTPCNKNITAEETSQLLIDNVWKRFGFPKVIISDRGPQFAAQVTRELWRKIGIEQKLSSAYHPQTDGESERVNQEIEQYLRICGNFQQDDWAKLLPIIEFAHNARAHRSTKKSPFEIWYGFHPTFQPPPYLQTRNQNADERVKYLEQIRKEVTAALHLAANEMRSSGPLSPSHTFHIGDQVLLDGTNLQTSHPKQKLAPKRYGPFKVTWTSPTNCRLKLPDNWKIHPVFHNSLLKPYKETPQHGSNFAKPPPEIVAEEEGHYEIEKILDAKPTRNRRSTQYLIKWKGYSEAENSWIPRSELKHAPDLLKEFEQRQHASQTPKEGIRAQAQQSRRQGPVIRVSRPKEAPNRGQNNEHRVQAQQSRRQGPTARASRPKEAPNRGQDNRNQVTHEIYSQQIHTTLQAQGDPKEGILSRAKPATTQEQARDPKNSTRPTYAQVLTRVARDPEKVSRDQSRAQRNPVTPRDPGKAQSHVTSRAIAHDISRGPSITRSRDHGHHVRFLRAARPLIGTWQTVG
jgi:hypothetical protein